MKRISRLNNQAMKRKNPTAKKSKYRVIYGFGFYQDCTSVTEAIKVMGDILKNTTFKDIKIEKL
jgi:hypothetical protein